MINPAETAPRQTVRSGERRPVSVLFTDMVGFTAIIERLGEDRALAFSRTIYKLLTDAVKDQGGTVHEFAGDSIMAVFGIPTAQEDAALRACRAALSIQARFAAAADSIAAQFGARPVMRVGVSSGVTVVAPADGAGSQLLAVGSTVNLASRIQALAPAGGCLICDATRAQVEGRVDLSFDGEHQIKGVTKAHKLWRVLAIRAGATRFDVSRARGLSPLVGRAAELAQIATELDRARDGLRVVDLVAEPGQGKTRLIFEFQRSADRGDAAILHGHCASDGRQTPFLPFIEVLRGSFRIRAEDDLPEISRRFAAGLRAAGLYSAENLGLLLNLLGLKPPEGALDGLDGVLIGLRTRDLLPALLRAECANHRVVLLLEDIHWIDTASEGVLRKLVETGAQANLLILHARRPDYVPDWLARPEVTQIALQPLTAADIRHLVQTRLGIDAPPEDLIARVTERAGGNPLFGEEILSFLIQQGALRIEGGVADFDASRGRDDLPASMQNLMAARIDSLASPDRALLQAAAAIGRRFDPGLLSLVAERPDETGAALQRLQAQDIVYREANTSDYVFKHVLLRDTVYQSLLSDHRAALHLAIGTALESRAQGRVSEAAETLAYHFALSDRADLAFKYNALAGAKSLGVSSLDAAARYFAAALALYQADPACATDAAFAACLADYAQCLNISLQVKPLIALAAKVLPILARFGDSRSHIHFLHHYVAALIVNARYMDALAARKDMSAMADRLGDHDARAYAMVSELAVQCYCEPLTTMAFQTKRQETEAVLARVDDAYLQNYFWAHLGFDSLCRGQIVGANAASDHMMLVGAARNDPRSLGYGTAMKALIAMCTDDYATAFAMSEQAVQVSRVDFEIAIATASRLSSSIPLNTHGGADGVRAFLGKCELNGWTLFGSGPDAMLGVALAMGGRIGAGIRHLEAAIARREAEGWLTAANWNRLFLCEIYIEILSGKGGASLGVLLRNAGALAGVLVYGPKRISALVEQVRAYPTFDPAGHYHARTELILGMLHKIKKRRAPATHHLTAALRIVKPTGPSTLQSRIETALAELAGPRVSRSTATDT